MANYEVQQCVKIVQFFYSSERSFILTQQKYREHFNVRTSPSLSMIRNLISHFEEMGTVANH